MASWTLTHQDVSSADLIVLEEYAAACEISWPEMVTRLLAVAAERIRRGLPIELNASVLWMGEREPGEKMVGPATNRWVELALEHSEANGRLLGIADHLAPKEDPGCDNPTPHPDHGAERCGGCYPCVLWQLRQAAERCKATQITFSELEAAADTDSAVSNETEGSN